MSRYKELCTYCFNQRELENANLELVSCPACSPMVSSYAAKEPVRLAERAVKMVLGKRGKYEQSK